MNISKLKFVEDRGLHDKISKYERTATWKDSDISFEIINFEYPFLHTHDYWEMFIILHGEMNHTINGDPYRVGCGDACVIRPDDSHKLCYFDNAKRGCVLLNFLVKSEYMKKVCEVYSSNLFQELLNSGRPLCFEMESVVGIQKKISDLQILSDASIEKVVLDTKILFNKVFNEFITNLMSTSNNYPDWLNEFLFSLRLSQFNYRNINEPISKTGYSYSRFAVLFKKYVGIPLVEYINRLKMNEAKELLLNTDLTTLDIASKLSFSSLSYFNRIYKKTFGCTPSETRKNK